MFKKIKPSTTTTTTHVRDASLFHHHAAYTNQQHPNLNIRSCIIIYLKENTLCSKKFSPAPPSQKAYLDELKINLPGRALVNVCICFLMNLPPRKYMNVCSEIYPLLKKPNAKLLLLFLLLLLDLSIISSVCMFSVLYIFI